MTAAEVRTALRTDMVRGSLWTLLSAVLSMPVAFVANLIVVRSLGTVEYGRFAFYVATYGVLVTLVNAGVSDATVQWLAGAHARGDREQSAALVRTCAGYHVFIEAPVVAVVTVLLLHDAPLGFVLAAVVANFVTMAIGTSTVVLTATARNAFAARVSLVMTLAAQATVAATAVVQHEGSAAWALRAVALAIGPCLAVAGVAGHLRPMLFRPRLPRRLPAGFLSYGVAAWSSALVTMLLLDESEIFVLRWYDDLAAVAVFAVLTTVANQLTVPMDSLMAPLVPIAAGLVGSAPHLASPALDRSLRVTALSATLTCGVALPAAAELLPAVFGGRYGHDTAAFVALATLSCLSSAAGPLRAFAFATRQVVGVLRINVLGLAVDAALALSLIPAYGLRGAVLALLVGQALSIVLVLRLVAKVLERRPGSVLVEVRAAVVGVVAGVAAVLAAADVDGTGVRTVVGVVVGAVIVLGSLRLLPGLRMNAGDEAVIVAGLPPRLGRAFVTTTRLLPLVRHEPGVGAV
ncbi:lipopolysaccharide biosynthesis protein [Jatrophihabitans sp.]|uniref:lipopolysaccharide biosynthesis protein n=1 Tax=Jatrophihabitans sp. TaxID=1932789 RepID=UPI0030C71A4C